MNWNNLKLRKCPICGSRLLRAHYYMRCSKRKGGVYKVKKGGCSFTIRKGRYKELGGLVKPSEKDEWYFRTESELEDFKYQERVMEEVKKIKKKAKRKRYYEKHPEKLIKKLR